jgi:serine/threonine-protein kinase RsbW
MNQLNTYDVKIDISIPSDTRYLEMIGRMGENLASSLIPHANKQCALPYNLNLVLTEAVANAIDHGNQCDPLKSVRILLTVSEMELIIKIYDQGQGFNLVKQCQKQSNKVEEGGRGIKLIRKLMDQVSCHKEDNGHVLILTKKLE